MKGKALRKEINIIIENNWPTYPSEILKKLNMEIKTTNISKYDYITGYHAVYSRNGEVIWRSSLDGLSSQVFSTGTPSVTIPDITITGQDKEIQIRRKSS